MKKIIIIGILVTIMTILTGCTEQKERTITIKNPSTTWLEEEYLTEDIIWENVIIEGWDE